MHRRRRYAAQKTAASSRIPVVWRCLANASSLMLMILGFQDREGRTAVQLAAEAGHVKVRHNISVGVVRCLLAVNKSISLH